MRKKPCKHERGTAIILYTVLLPAMLLITGLGVDLVILYVIEARLSAATDGAALGAGRLIGSSANINEIATEFLQATFPPGYWGSYNFTPSISVTTNGSLHTVQVAATVNAPLMFLRLLRQNNALVTATATATRRDVRLVMALDRSGSMASQIPNLRTSATNFANMFHPGVDELGLVVYGSSALVAYPTARPYSLTTGTGPDVHWADTPAPGQDNLLTMLAAIQVGDNTNTSEALWMAYNEIQKAQALDGDTTKLNVIVLFTDGYPNGFTAFVNDPSNNALSGSSGCTYNPSTGSASQMIGWMASTWNGPVSTWYSNGIFSPLAFDNSQTLKTWVSLNSGGSSISEAIFLTGTPMSGAACPGSMSNLSGLAIIPPQDVYGHSTTDTAYTQGALYNEYNIAYDNTQPMSGYHQALASWSAADNTAQAILAAPENVMICAIGFTGLFPVDPVLLKRIANTQDSTSYNSSFQTGIYAPASDAATLNTAFQNVASQVLRLTH